MKQKFANFRSDYIGMVSAILCLIHCIILPVIFALRAVDFEHDVEGHFKWDYLFLALSFYAVYHSAKHSPSPLIKMLFWANFSVLTLCIFLENISEAFEYMIILASIGLVVVHFINIRHCQRCMTHVVS